MGRRLDTTLTITTKKVEYDSPLVQFRLINMLKKAEDINEIENIMPTILANHFGSFELNYLKEYKKETLDPMSNPSPIPSPNTTAFKFNTPKCPIVCNEPASASTQRAIKKSYVPPNTNGMGQGMVIMDLDTKDQFNAEIVEKHARVCSPSSLKLVEQEHNGWELDLKYHCNFCQNHSLYRQVQNKMQM